MGRYTPLERAFVWTAFSVIVAVASFILFDWTRSRRPLAPGPEGAPAAEPPAARLRDVSVEGRLVDVPGFPVRPAILGRTRVSLRIDGRMLGEELMPEPDGSFAFQGRVPPGNLALRVRTQLHVNLFDRTLDREVVQDHRVSAPSLGDLPLPRSEDLGAIEFQVVDAAGGPLDPVSVGLDAVEGSGTPDVGIARLDELDLAANAPTEYRRGHRGTILRVPPGEYRVRASVPGRLMEPALAVVGRGPSAIVIREAASSLRVRGVVREAETGRLLEDVEVGVSSIAWAGPATRDPARVLMRTRRSGAYELPLPAPLPAGGVRLSFTRAGYRSTDVEVKEERFKGGPALALDVDLGWVR